MYSSIIMAEKTIYSVCQRVLVREFYLQNAGFFVISGLFLVVFLGGDSLQVLSSIAVKSPDAMLAGFIAPSLLYGWKCLSWASKQIRAEENAFLRHLILMPVSEQLNLLLRIMSGLLMPLYPFTVLLLSRAIHLQILPAVLLMAGFFLVLHLVPAFWLIKVLKGPFDYLAGTRRNFLFRLNLGPGGWLLNQLIREAPLMLIWTKLLSMGLMTGAMVLYYSDSYDHRLLSLALTASAFLHLGLLDELRKLEEKLSFLKNLPFSATKRLWLTAGMLLPFLLPEILIFLRNCPAEPGWGYRLTAPFFYAGLVLLNSQLRNLYWLFPHLREKLLPSLFFFLSLMLMYKIPVVLPTIIFYIAAFLLNKQLYYKTEGLFNEKAQ